MRVLIAVLSLLIMSFTAQAGFEPVKPEVRAITVEEIRTALLAHYKSLSANEQWGVGMGCTLGHLENLVAGSKSLMIDSERGFIVADSGFRPNLLHGDVREVMVIRFVPNTEKILEVRVKTLSKTGEISSCSTRNRLLKFLN